MIERCKALSGVTPDNLANKLTGKPLERLRSNAFEAIKYIVGENKLKHLAIGKPLGIPEVQHSDLETGGQYRSYMQVLRVQNLPFGAFFNKDPYYVVTIIRAALRPDLQHCIPYKTDTKNIWETFYHRFDNMNGEFSVITQAELLDDLDDSKTPMPHLINYKAAEYTANHATELVDSLVNIALNY